MLLPPCSLLVRGFYFSRFFSSPIDLPALDKDTGAGRYGDSLPNMDERGVL